jgi:SAM-dependent methyltransferase
MSQFLTDYPRYAWQMLTGNRLKGELDSAAERQREIEPYLDCRRPLRVLDLANGRLRPQYALLRAAGHRVAGIDLVNRPPRTKTDLAYVAARRIYTWRLGLPAKASDTSMLTCGNVAALPFPDNSFDLVTSVAAFEHFLDVPAVVAELHRVVRPGGLLWISIHLFTSPSGGHNLHFTGYPVQSVPRGVDPWDHLRARRLPFHVPLNEWRRDQYLEAFARHFEILKHYCRIREGTALLTPELEAELSAYSRDELTCKAYAIVARKR